MGQATKKGKKSGQGIVKVIADGTNKVSLVFPSDAKLTGKGKLSADKVLALLRAAGEGKVVGQQCPPFTCTGDCPSFVCHVVCGTCREA